MTDFAVAVLTAKKPDELLRQGGSGPWVGAEPRVMALKYIVCVPKAEPRSSDRGSLLMVSRIQEVIQHGYDKRGQKRWFFRFGEYARVDLKTSWEWRNPVKYTTLDELGIKLNQLKFQAGPTALHLPDVIGGSATKPLTIVEAKAGLALKFGVSPEAIEIHIKG